MISNRSTFAGAAPRGAHDQAGCTPGIGSDAGVNAVRAPLRGRNEWLRRCDEVVGPVLCASLTLVRRIARWFGAEPASAAPARSVVFIKLAEQGATVPAAETIAAAAAALGRDHVHILVFAENRAVVDVLGLVPPRNVLTVRTDGLVQLVVSGIRCVRELRRRRVGACVDLEFFARFSAALAYLSGARFRSGFDAAGGRAPYRGDLLTHRVPYDPRQHTSRAFARLWDALEGVIAGHATAGRAAFVPGYRHTDADQAAVDRLLESVGVGPGDPLILLNANAGDLLPLRRWDPRNYVELAARLLAAFPDLRILFTGTGAEAAAVEKLVRRVDSPRCASVAGRTSLAELLLLYDRSEVLVTNDSGPGHFAALTRIDAVVLFGPETPLRFAGLGERTHPLWAGLDCSPCVSVLSGRRTSCRDNVCLKRISVDLVFSTVCRLHCRRLSPVS